MLTRTRDLIAAARNPSVVVTWKPKMVQDLLLALAAELETALAELAEGGSYQQLQTRSAIDTARGKP